MPDASPTVAVMPRCRMTDGLPRSPKPTSSLSWKAQGSTVKKSLIIEGFALTDVGGNRTFYSRTKTGIPFVTQLRKITPLSFIKQIHFTFFRYLYLFRSRATIRESLKPLFPLRRIARCTVCCDCVYQDPQVADVAGRV